MHIRKLIGGILLVSGTTIGAAMLALPISTGLAGFVPSLLLFLFYWVFMTYTAFLMLETNFWVEKDANLVSMARKTLGLGGEIVSWLFYLFLLYALTTAYIAGSSPIFLDLLHGITGIHFPAWVGSIPLLVIFGGVVYKGTKTVDLANRLLMAGLVVSYCLLVIFLTPHFDSALLKRMEWQNIGVAISLIATSFGYHIIIPTLMTYMDRDVKMLKATLLIGGLIPLIVYIMWDGLALGILQMEGEYGLLQAYAKGQSGAYLLSLHLSNDNVAIIARVFSFFAIITSFLGVSLALSDFLADGLKIKKTAGGRAFLYLLTFAPPLVLTLTDPRIFLTALEYAGAFGVIVLLAFMPALMVWSGRYWRNFPAVYRTPGGKFALLLIMFLSLVIIGIEISNQIGI